MSRGLTAAPRSRLVLFLADTGVTPRRKAITQNLPALRASPWLALFPLSSILCSPAFPGVSGFPFHTRWWWEGRAVLGCLWKPPCCLLLGSSLCWVAPRGGIALAELFPPTASSSPLSLMVSLKLEEIKPPQFALSWDELVWVY